MTAIDEPTDRHDLRCPTWDERDIRPESCTCRDEHGHRPNLADSPTMAAALVQAFGDPPCNADIEGAQPA